MANRYEIRLSGSGGQGLIVAGIILAEAAGIHDGKYVCQTQSYGPEARGGASKAEVVISEEEIDYPKAIKPDVLLAMNQKACDAYFFDMKPDGMLVVDSTFVKQLPTTRDLHSVYPPFPGKIRQGNRSQHHCTRSACHSDRCRFTEQHRGRRVEPGASRHRGTE